MAGKGGLVGKINVLSFAVANLIAAGEVVDRPASVIKELLENAIDSGATRIVVEIQNGGVTYMRVTDNGCGMEPEDLPVAIRRHATSKIKEAEDLDRILTLGFRGEALAAIASVSDLRIISKTHSSLTGAVLEAHGGSIAGVSERASSDGTTVIVENLFANVPARRKFLKKDLTEAMAVGSVVEKIALSRPDIAFRFISDGTIKTDTVGDGNLKNAVYSVFGREFASKLIPAELENEGIRVKGFVGRSDNVRANRNYQNFFINGRYVKSKTAMAAIEQAYTSYIPPEKFPCCVLFMTINPNLVDVNVHPAKLEVKFSNEKPVFEAVYYAAKNALEENTARPDLTLGAPKKGGWTVSRMSEAPLPVEEGKRESLAARQMESELFFRTSGEPEKEAMSGSGAGKSQTAFETMRASDYVRTYAAAERSPQHAELRESLLTRKTEPKVESAQIPTLVRSEAPKKSVGLENSSVNSDVTVSDDDQIAVPTASDDAVTQAPLPLRTENAVSEDTDTERIDRESTRPESQGQNSGQSLNYRIIGEAFNAYVLVENADRLLLIDKHAAHERILFEQLKARMKSTKGTSQILMLPVEVMLTSDEIELLDQYRSEMEAVGFTYTTGKYVANVTAIPEGIGIDAVPDMLSVMVDRIKNDTGSARLTRDIIFEKALYQAACKAAIKAGREYPPEYIQWLVARMMELPDITVCPHGRPVAMVLTKRNLDHQFERI